MKKDKLGRWQYEKADGRSGLVPKHEWPSQDRISAAHFQQMQEQYANEKYVSPLHKAFNGMFGDSAYGNAYIKPEQIEAALRKQPAQECPSRFETLSFTRDELDGHGREEYLNGYRDCAEAMINKSSLWYTILNIILLMGVSISMIYLGHVLDNVNVDGINLFNWIGIS